MFEKPEQKQMTFYDYHDCEQYIAQLIYGEGHMSLRSIPGYTYKDEEYRDFWHVLCDYIDIHNGSFIYMPDPMYLKDEDQWATPICQAFINEFGEDTEYWVSW